MKKALFRTLFIICALAAAVTAAASQETRFSVEILGTSRFEDIAVIHDGLRRSDGVLDLRVVRSSRNYVKLEGTTSGGVDHLISDLAGLAQDRFDVKAERPHQGFIAITLRKLDNVIPTARAVAKGRRNPSP